MAASRPWRAIAYREDWTAPRGRRRVVVGRISACTRDGLTRWVNAQRAQGHAVDVITVEPIDLPTPPPPDHSPVELEAADTPML